MKKLSNYFTLTICFVAALVSVANLLGGTAGVIMNGAAAIIATILLIITIIGMRRDNNDE